MCSTFKRIFFILVCTCYCGCKLGGNFIFKKSIYCYASHFTVNQGHMNDVKCLDQVCSVDDESIVVKTMGLIMRIMVVKFS